MKVDALIPYRELPGYLGKWQKETFDEIKRKWTIEREWLNGDRHSNFKTIPFKNSYALEFSHSGTIIEFDKCHIHSKKRKMFAISCRRGRAQLRMNGSYITLPTFSGFKKIDGAVIPLGTICKLRVLNSERVQYMRFYFKSIHDETYLVIQKFINQRIMRTVHDEN